MFREYGETGLFWVFRRADGNYRRDFLLSRDYRAIFGFLGLDPVPWERGFGSLEAMFCWVITSPYFSVAPYLDRAPTTERRARMRPTFRAFLELIEERQLTTTYEYASDRSGYAPMVARAFPDAQLLDAIAVERDREARVNAVRAVFSGRVVMVVVDVL